MTNQKLKSIIIGLGIVSGVLVLCSPVALAALNFNGTSISATSNFTVDALNSISIGTSTATSIVIGSTNSTTSISPQSGQMGGFYVTTSGYIGNNPNPVAPIDFSNFNLDYTAPQQIVFATALVQGEGLVDLATRANVSVTNGTLLHGGPTFRCHDCQWDAGPAGPDGTTAITLDLGDSVPISGIVFGSYYRDSSCTLGGVAIDGSNDGVSWTNFANPTYHCQLIATFAHGGFNGPTFGNWRYVRISYTIGGASNIMAGLQVLSDERSAMWDGASMWGAAFDGLSANFQGSPSGAVGIGLTGLMMPTSKLQVLMLDPVNPKLDALDISDASGTTSFFHVTKAGRVGIGTSTPQAAFQIATTTSTIRVGAAGLPGCLEMEDAGGSSITYITTSAGVLTSTTTKPAICQ